MKRSKAFIKTYRETPSDADSINASLLVRAGFVQKHMAGVYAFLPLGMKVLKRIEIIVRQEMNRIDGQEILMNVLQPKELWEETNRWQEADEILYKFKDKSQKDVALAPTHEEQVTDIVRHHISSYKDLPLSLYQIQTKFRNEPRAKSGVLRGKEFIMKDMYSFHTDQEDFDQYYENAKGAYLKVFSRMGLDAKIVAASGGVFSKYSHEFQVITPVGEDTIYICDSCEFAENKEIASVKEGDKCPNCSGKIHKENSIEVGNIFPLKNKFSSSMKATILDKTGKEVEMIMGCYGIGISRLLGTIVEIHHDNKGMIWPENVAPYPAYLISLGKNEEAEKLYENLKVKGNIHCLYDDREATAGEKFADSDLIGLPYRILVSEKSLKAGGYEVTKRSDDRSKIMTKEEIIKNFSPMFDNKDNYGKLF